MYSTRRPMLRPRSKTGDLAAARIAVARIVGRNPEALDHRRGRARVNRKPRRAHLRRHRRARLSGAFYFGLPGIAAYKAISTADSMIAHKTERHIDFGRAAASLDDIANWVPARLTALSVFRSAAEPSSRPYPSRLAMQQTHRSPNAGWPEAAMAGALDVRLSGPRLLPRRPKRRSCSETRTRADPTACRYRPRTCASICAPVGLLAALLIVIAIL